MYVCGPPAPGHANAYLSKANSARRPLIQASLSVLDARKVPGTCGLVIDHGGVRCPKGLLTMFPASAWSKYPSFYQCILRRITKIISESFVHRCWWSSTHRYRRESGIKDRVPSPTGDRTCISLYHQHRGQTPDGKERTTKLFSRETPSISHRYLCPLIPQRNLFLGLRQRFMSTLFAPLIVPTEAQIEDCTQIVFFDSVRIVFLRPVNKLVPAQKGSQFTNARFEIFQ